jgi:hypothetical protein
MTPQEEIILCSKWSKAWLREELHARRFSAFSDDLSAVGDEDITCFNQEWRGRCYRMFTPARKEHARHLYLIHECITDGEPLKERNIYELRKCPLE